jgi:hypothetical protein
VKINNIHGTKYIFMDSAPKVRPHQAFSFGSTENYVYSLFYVLFIAGNSYFPSRIQIERKFPPFSEKILSN